jgi:hypothetical protein
MVSTHSKSMLLVGTSFRRKVPIAIMKGERSTPSTFEAWGNILASRLVDVPAVERRGEERRGEGMGEVRGERSEGIKQS